MQFNASHNIIAPVISFYPRLRGVCKIKVHDSSNGLISVKTYDFKYAKACIYIYENVRLNIYFYT